MPEHPARHHLDRALSAGHAALGAELKRTRIAAGRTLRSLSKYSSGHLSNVEGGSVTPSRELVRYYIEELRGDPSLLMGLYNSAVDQREQHKRRQRAERRGENAEEHQNTLEDIADGYKITTKESAFRLHSSGAINEVRYFYSIRARRPGVKFFHAAHTYTAERRRGIFTVEPATGCRLHQVIESATGAIRVLLELDQELHEDSAEPYQLSYLLKLNTKVVSVPVLGYTNSNFLPRYSLRVHFDDASSPVKVWWFQTRSVQAELPGDYEPDPSRIMPHDPYGYYSHEFLALERGTNCGIAWVWRRLL